MVRLARLSPTDPVLRLPHPHLTPFYVLEAASEESGKALYYIASDGSGDEKTHDKLHGRNVIFSEPEDPKSSDRPADANNTPWARARRSPSFTITLSKDGPSAPTLGQLWLIVYVIFTLSPTEELFRLRLEGLDADSFREQLKVVSLAVNHPRDDSASPQDTASQHEMHELLVLRSTFWQGAGSPFGARPVWVPDAQRSELGRPISAYPLPPLDYHLASDPGAVLAWHPRRPVKPRPGNVVYSRWIPHLQETFSMIALDFEDARHQSLFHTWQNDPRVSQGWNLTGTLEQHRAYLRRAHEDPHRLTLMARFDETYFAYFEVYWAKEDRLGAYYDAGDFDRGRHSLVGDVQFRGPHRVSAWWSSLMHYLFLDDPRTAAVVGEPRHTNSTVLGYDLIHGFGLDKFVDLPDKRSGFMRCSRERFFQLCPLGESEKVVGGTRVGLVPKL